MQTIPAASPAPEMPSAPPLPAATTGGNPFGPPSPMSTATPGGEQNPYQAPPSYPGHDLYGPPGAGTSTLYRPTPIDIGDVLARAWEIYKDQLWMCVGVVLICGIINYAAQFVAQLITTGMQLAGLPIIALIVVNFFLVILQMVFQIWIGVGQRIFFLKVAHGETASIGNIFEGGPYLLRTILATLLVVLGMAGIIALCAIPAALIYFATKEPGPAIGALVLLYVIPAVYVSLTFYQYVFLIIDHDLGAIDSLYASREITRGNKLSIFAVSIIGGLLIIVGLLACCIGAFFAAPYVVLCMTTMYVLMSGGQTAAAIRR
ncbi:MAG TPA: hypothetical protein VMV10_13725 [Pirellulales bacterium]|nr:hypothetical protein [Pirellulales bacterium]